jgi:hypothetical protein
MWEFDRHAEEPLRAPNTREIDAAMAAMAALCRSLKIELFLRRGIQ